MRVPVVSSGGARFEQQARNGGDGGQRFAAESESGDGEQILDVAQFAGGVALEGEQGVVAQHAAAIVDDADEAAAAGFHFDAKVGGAGIEGVFEQFLDDGSGALDYFAGGDFVRDLVGKYADAAHDEAQYNRGVGVSNIPLTGERVISAQRGAFREELRWKSSRT